MISGQGKYESWTTIIIDQENAEEVIAWCRSNFGRKFVGFMDTAFGWRLSNWGRWNYRISEYAVVFNLDIKRIRIFLRKPEDIVLFMLRWA